MWDFEDGFIDEEDIVAKVQFIQDLTAQHPYAGWMGSAQGYMDRIRRALAALPKRYHNAALALFASVIYLPRPMLEEAWRQIALELNQRMGWTAPRGFRDALILAVDDPGLVTEFSHSVGIPQREDHDVNPGYGTVSEMIGRADTLCRAGRRRDELPSDILVAMRKRWWLLLTDNALSGGSAKSDIRKLLDLKRLLCSDDDGNVQCDVEPEILFCGQIVTQQALDTVGSLLPPDHLFYGLKYDDHCRVTSDDCRLYSSREVLNSVRELCEWFGDTHIAKHTKQDRFATRLAEHQKRGGRASYAFGWRDCGYTLVTERNCPSNSVPVLYYQPNEPHQPGAHRYIPPFIRTESRESHVTSDDASIIQSLLEESNRQIIRKAIAELEERQ